jgi:manganese oxidase
MVSRREALLTSVLAGSTALLASRRAQSAQSPRTIGAWDGSYSGGNARSSKRPGQPGADYRPVYHAHHDEMTQMAMGMMGMIVVHPRQPSDDYRVDRDFVIMLSEWRIEPGTSRPDPNAMSDFNVLTMNALAFPGTEPLVVKTGERVRIRFGNLSAMDHHPIHLHGHYFKVTATDGGTIPVSAQWPETTVLVPVGSTRDIELVADAPGDWAMHCHMTHHVMNQMGHGIPNMTGVKHKPLDKAVRPLLPGYMTMGQDGMGDMGDMGMAVPRNSIPMVGAQGPYTSVPRSPSRHRSTALPKQPMHRAPKRMSR